MKPSFVVDCSVLVPCFFEDETQPYAERVLEALREAQAAAPILWKLEFANVLLVAERKKRITRQQAASIQNAAAKLPVQDDWESLARGLSHVWALGREYGLTAYDAAYLELAMRLELPLATLDAQLRAAAKAAGVALFGVRG